MGLDFLICKQFFFLNLFIYMTNHFIKQLKTPQNTQESNMNRNSICCNEMRLKDKLNCNPLLTDGFSAG